MNPWRFLSDLSAQCEQLTGKTLVIRSAAKPAGKRLVLGAGTRRATKKDEIWVSLSGTDLVGYEISMVVIPKRDAVCLHFYSDKSDTHEYLLFSKSRDVLSYAPGMLKDFWTISELTTKQLMAKTVGGADMIRATSGEVNALLFCATCEGGKTVTDCYGIHGLVPSDAELDWIAAVYAIRHPEIPITAQRGCVVVASANSAPDAPPPLYWVHVNDKHEAVEAEKAVEYYKLGLIHYVASCDDPERKWLSLTDAKLI